MTLLLSRYLPEYTGQPSGSVAPLQNYLGTTTSGGSAVSSLTLTSTHAVTLGQLIVVWANCAVSTTNITSATFSDSSGNTWQAAVSLVHNTIGSGCSWVAAAYTSIPLTTSSTITTTLVGGGTGKMALTAASFTNIEPYSAYGAATATVTTTPTVSTSASIASGDVVFGTCWSTADLTALPTGFLDLTGGTSSLMNGPGGYETTSGAGVVTYTPPNTSAGTSFYLATVAFPTGTFVGGQRRVRMMI